MTMDDVVLEEPGAAVANGAGAGASTNERKARQLFSQMRESVLGPGMVRTVRFVLHGTLPLMMDYPHELKGPYEIPGVRPRGWDRARPDLPDEEQQMLLKCYWGEDGCLCWPTMNLMESLRDAGKEWNDPVYPKRSLRHMIEMAVTFGQETFPLQDGDGQPIERWSRIEKHTPGTRSGSRILVEHPVVDLPWQIPGEMTINMAKTYHSLDPIHTVLVEAGRSFGIGAWRKRPYGRFEVEWMPQA